MKTHLLRLLPLALLFTAACTAEESVNVNQDRIRTEYEVFYDQNRDTTFVMAQFYLGDGSGALKLTAPSEVTYNGTPLEFKTSYGPDLSNVRLNRYLAKFKGQIGGGTILFKDVNNRTFSVTAPAFEAINLPTDFTTFSRLENKTITWTGAPVRTNETVTAYLYRSGEVFSTRFVNQTTPGATSLIFSVDYLNDYNANETGINAGIQQSIQADLTASQTPYVGMGITKSFVRTSYRGQQTTVAATN